MVDGKLMEYEICQLIERIRVLKYSNYDQFIDLLNEELSRELEAARKSVPSTNALGTLGDGDGDGDNSRDDMSIYNIRHSDLERKVSKGEYNYYYLRRLPSRHVVFDNIKSGGIGYSLANLITESNNQTIRGMDEYVGKVFAKIEGLLNLFGLGSDIVVDGKYPVVDSVGKDRDDSELNQLPNLVLSEDTQTPESPDDSSYDVKITLPEVLRSDVKSISRTTRIKRSLNVSISVTRSILVICFFTRADIPLLKD